MIIKKIFAQNPTPECIEVPGPFGNICERLENQGIEEGGTTIIQEIAGVISKIVGFFTLLAGLWFLFQIIIAGYAWIASGGDPQKIEAARNRIVFSLIGLTIIVAAIAIMGVIQFMFGVDFLLRNPADIVRNLRVGGPTPTP